MIESEDLLARTHAENNLRKAEMQAVLKVPGGRVENIPYSGQLTTEQFEGVDLSLEISNPQILDALAASNKTFTMSDGGRLKFDTFRFQGDPTIHVITFPANIEHLDAIKSVKGGDKVDFIDMGYVNKRPDGKFLFSEDSAGADRVLRSPFDQRRLETVDAFRGRYAAQASEFQSDSALDKAEAAV